MKWKPLSHVQVFATPWTYSPWNSPGQNTGVGSHSLLQGILPTHGWNSGLLHRMQILYQLSHQWSPRIREWVAHPFFSWCSQPRNRTEFSYIAGRFFIGWATSPLFCYKKMSHPEFSNFYLSWLGKNVYHNLLKILTFRFIVKTDSVPGRTIFHSEILYLLYI